jgi:hypothetical protein
LGDGSEIMPAVVGVFPGRNETESAIDELVRLGISEDAIGVVWREKTVQKPEEVKVVVYVDHFDEPAVEARKGAIGGAVGGSVTGVGSVLLASAGVVALSTPVGAFFAAGSLAAAAVAGAAGAVGGSVLGGLIGALLGATDHDATKVTTVDTQLEDVIERDGFAMTVEAPESDVERVSGLLAGLGARDISVLREHGEQPRTVTLRHDD